LDQFTVYTLHLMFYTVEMHMFVASTDMKSQHTLTLVKITI